MFMWASTIITAHLSEQTTGKSFHSSSESSGRGHINQNLQQTDIWSHYADLSNAAAQEGRGRVHLWDEELTLCYCQ